MYKVTAIKKSNDVYYYIQQTVRKGNKVSSHTTEKLGKHSELLKLYDDPRQYAEDRCAELNREYDEDKDALHITVDTKGKNIPQTNERVVQSTALNVGYFYLQYVLGKLKLKKYFAGLSKDRQFEYDPYDIHRFLVYDRIMYPRSKRQTGLHLINYYEKPDIKNHSLLRYMSLLAQDYDGYLEYLFDMTSQVVRRDLSVCYYDCSNVYYEIDFADEEWTDETTGETIDGLRQFGVRKDHRANPIVEMGLMMDSEGIPITMSLHPGNTGEQITAIPLERKVIRMLNEKDVIYCADAGLGSYSIRAYNSLNCRHFVITQSLKKLSGVLREAVFDHTDYYLWSDHTAKTVDEMKSFDRSDPDNRNLYNDKIYKVIPADTLTELPGFFETKTTSTGKTKQVKTKGMLKQWIVVTFSRKQFEYQRAIRNRQIERARQLLANAVDPEEIRKSSHDVRRFIRRKKNNGEKLEYEIDEERIKDEEQYDGYYGIATNLEVMNSKGQVDKAVLTRVFETAAGRWKIEADFRLTETWHQNPDRIKAHFLICYTSLLVRSLVEKLFKDAGAHYTPEEIAESLRNMMVSPIEKKMYIANYEGASILDDFQRITNVSMTKQYYGPTTLDKIVKKLL